MVISVDDNEFEEKVLKSSIPVLVDFWAEWCGPCKQIAPILDEISSVKDNKLLVVKINIDSNPNTPSFYGVRGIPTLMLFKDGEKIATKVGAMPQSVILEWIDNNI